MSVTGYLGPSGSYSELAARMSGRGEARAFPSFRALVGALTAGEVEGIVLPVENSLNGGVMQNLDLLQDTTGIIAVEEERVTIEHRLVMLEGADAGGITRIYSHPQALEQCAGYLFSRFPEARQIATPSTSACIDMIKTVRDAGIVGRGFSRPGYVLLPDIISDEPLNFTQFLYVVRGDESLLSRTRKVFLSFVCTHRPGSLNGALSAFAAEGINMTKIESRPIKDIPGEYRFFIEIEGDYSSPEVRRALRSLADMCRSIKILGGY